MKKFFLVLALALGSVFTANAQVWLGGNLGFWTGDNSMDKTLTTATIAPEIGYSFNNSNWSIAAALGYNYSKVEDFDAVNTFTLTPYVRYNVCNVEKFSFFLDGAFDMAFYKDLSDDNETSIQVGIKPGIAFHPTAKWAAVAHFGFLGYSDGKYDGFNRKGFGLNGSLSVASVGLYYNF